MLVVVTFGYRLRRRLSRRFKQARGANQTQESATRPESNTSATDSIRDEENSDAPTGSTPITTLTLTEVLTDPSIRHDDSQCIDDEYLEVDSQWAGPAPSASV